MTLSRLAGSVLGLSFALTLATTTLSPSASYGQASTAAGSLQGTILDPAGAALPGASIVVTNLGTSNKKSFTADKAGFYSAGSLVPGSYKITVTTQGFSTQEKTVVVQIGTVTNGDVHMTIGATTEVVSISSDTIGVNTTQSTVSGVLTADQIDSLPINGRNFLDLAQLEPGVQLQSGETFDPTKAGYSSISINGVNGRTARILLDGQDISDETVGTTTLNVSKGSIEEFEISRSSLDISTELTSSGAVTVSTRSGTNKIHGQAFGLFRDQRAGAAADPGGNNYPAQRDQFGGRIGGPILHDNLFAFLSYERVKQDTFNSVQNLAPFQALNGGYTSPFRDNYSVGRLDYDGPKGIHLFFRGAYEANLDDATFGYGYARYGNKDNTPAFAGGGDFILGKLNNSFRVSYLKFHNLITDQSKSGVPNLVPGAFFTNSTVITGPNLLAPQQTYQSDKQFRYDGGLTLRSHLISFGASVNRILGGGFASFFGFGPEIDANFNAGPTGTGGSGLASDPTAYPVADIVMGNGNGYDTEIPQFNAPAGGQGDYRLGVYIGDTWKVTPKLTVNYGIRYGRDTGRSDHDLAPLPCSVVSTANFGSFSPCTDTADGGFMPASGYLLDSIVKGLNLGGRVAQPNKDLGPKAGFAYDPIGNGKTVIRGGAGLYYENNIFNNTLFDRPGKLAQGLFFGDSYLPSGTASFKLPNGTTVTSINGTPLANLWNEAASVSGPDFVMLQQMYQAATKGSGPAANGSYVGNTLTEGAATGLSFYTPNFVTPRSIQLNIGIQQEVRKGTIVTADYVRNVGEHFYQAYDVNHDGDASTLNVTAAQNAISSTANAFGCGMGYNTAAIDCAISNGAMLSDFAGNGLDSGRAYLQNNPVSAFNAQYGLTPSTGAAFPGINPLWGQINFNFPLGRSVYNGLQTNLRQTSRLPIPGLKFSSFEVSYTLSKFISSGGADQNFTPGVIDQINPLAYSGPSGTDRTHQLSYGGTFRFIGGVEADILGHYYSALPSNLSLTTDGQSTGEIFKSDVTGDGTTGDLLPGTKAGAFGRTVKAGDLGRVITAYNATSAGRITPAGQSLINNGLFNMAELTSIGATTRSIAPAPYGNAPNGSLRTFDLTLERPVKYGRLGEKFSVVPSISFFNAFNFANYGNVSGVLADAQEPGAANGTTTSLDSRGALRVGNGSGVFSQGAARVLEYGLAINF
jgi:hypothetical protein